MFCIDHSEILGVVLIGDKMLQRQDNQVLTNAFKIQVDSTCSVGLSVLKTNDEEAIIGPAVEICLSLQCLAREYILYLFQQDFYSRSNDYLFNVFLRTGMPNEHVELTFILNAFVRTWSSCLCGNLSPINDSQISE